MVLTELLKEHEDKIVMIKRRLYFLLEFDRQLKGISQDKEFRIKNDIVWRLIQDTWSMLIIDFASLARGMLRAGGFFNQLKTRLNELKPAKRKEAKAPKGRIQFDEDHVTAEEAKKITLKLEDNIVDMMMRMNRETLFELFPNARGRNPLKISHEDVDDLKRRFENIVSDVINERDSKHAHRYEQTKDKFVPGKLNSEELRIKLEKVEQIFNQIRAILSDSSLSYNDMNRASKSETARDLIVTILWGSSKIIDIQSGLNKQLSARKDAEGLVYGYQLRDKLIADSQIYHDRIVNGDLKPDVQTDLPAKGFCFNDIDLENMRKKKL